MKIYPIRELPVYFPAMLESLENHWPACMPWIKKHMAQVLQTKGPLPDAYIAVEGDKVVGGRRGGELGFGKIYLATEHTNYYEKYGFYTIGPDACAWGEPTQMFENTTLPGYGKTA